MFSQVIFVRNVHMWGPEPDSVDVKLVYFFSIFTIVEVILAL